MKQVKKNILFCTSGVLSLLLSIGLPFLFIYLISILPPMYTIACFISGAIVLIFSLAFAIFSLLELDN